MRHACIAVAKHCGYGSRNAGIRWNAVSNALALV
jgi:hypothetical protein